MLANFNMTEEILDIVNEKDEIVGQASHEEIHKKKLKVKIDLVH